MPTTRSLLALPLLAAWFVSCDGLEDDGVLRVRAMGSMASFVYLDRDVNGTFDPAVDAPARGVRVALVRSERDTVGTGVTSDLGVALIVAVPVGQYGLTIDRQALGDSLLASVADTGRVMVLARDTLTTSVALAPPSLSMTLLREEPEGRLVFTRGTVLSGWASFGDSTVHVADSTGAIRLVRVRTTPVAVGDSVGVQGRVSRLEGQAVLLDPRLVPLGKGLAAAARTVATNTAAHADGGRLDAALVRIEKAPIMDAHVTSGGEFAVSVDDGTGALEVVFDPDARITTTVPPLAGAQLDATGVLVPHPAGGWRLKPRGSSDVKVTLPTLSVADARLRPPGMLVAVEGVALNGYSTFGDATLHLADPTGAIRGINVPASFVFAGDSIRLIGVLALSAGALVLENATPTILGKAKIPPPTQITTAVAAGADGGRLDAALVRVTDAVVQDTATLASGAFRLRVDDGSGVLEVLFTGHAGPTTSASYAPQMKLDITGLLVPLADRRGWMLKPRKPDDVTKL